MERLRKALQANCVKTYVVASFKSNTRRRSATNRRSNNHSMAPPPYHPDTVVGRTFRFQAAEALDYVAVSSTDLLNLMVMAKTATTTARLIAAIKVRHVEVWGAMSSSLIPVTASVEFTRTGDVGSKRDLFSDTSMGSNRPAYVSAKPSSKSAAGMWASTAGTAAEIFRLSCPDNSIIDVHVTMTLFNVDDAVAGPGAAGATAGTVYYAPLSGASAETLPVSATVLPGV